MTTQPLSDFSNSIFVYLVVVLIVIKSSCHLFWSYRIRRARM